MLASARVTCTVRRRSVSPASRSAPRLADAEDRLEPGRERRGHLVGQRLVVLAEVLAALGVPEQHAGRTRVDEHRHADLAGEGADRCGVRVLAARTPTPSGASTSATSDRQGNGRGHREVDLVQLVDARGERLGERPRLRPELVHLPVAGDERRAGFLALCHQGASVGQAGTIRVDGGAHSTDDRTGRAPRSLLARRGSRGGGGDARRRRRAGDLPPGRPRGRVGGRVRRRRPELPALALGAGARHAGGRVRPVRAARLHRRAPAAPRRRARRAFWCR